MKLSKVLAITLLGAVAMTNTAMASGTTAGTKISNTPTLTYSMGGANKSLKAPVSSYVVDKVINFTLTRSEATEHKVVAGRTKIVEFKLTNIGNSKENFKLSKWHNVHNVKFLSKKFYVDVNGNGVLDKAEKVDNAFVKNLSMDKSRKIWMELKIDPKAVIGKRSDSGILAQAVNRSLKPYVASAKNTMNKEDIVFADGRVYAPVDKARDGKMSMWYGFTIIQDVNNVKLNIVKEYERVVKDPVNGTRNPKAIPGAQVLLKYQITNKTKTEAKNVKFTINYDASKVRLAASKEIVEYGVKKPYFITDSRGRETGRAVESKKGTITFTIPSIKPGVTYYPHTATIIK
jgi:uncharacterized cupredoxin-like copper-binding protein